MLGSRFRQIGWTAVPAESCFAVQVLRCGSGLGQGLPRAQYQIHGSLDLVISGILHQLSAFPLAVL